MEEGEIGSETDQDPSVLKVPAVNWAKCVGVNKWHKNGPRTERGHRKTQRLGYGKCRQGNGNAVRQTCIYS